MFSKQKKAIGNTMRKMRRWYTDILSPFMNGKVSRLFQPTQSCKVSLIHSKCYYLIQNLFSNLFEVVPFFNILKKGL